MDSMTKFRCNMNVARLLILFISLMLVQGSAIAGQIDEWQARIQAIPAEIKNHQAQLGSLRTEYQRLKRAEPAKEKAYREVSDEWAAALKKADSADEQAHKDAMIVSFRFNRIDREYRRFQEQKQELEAGIESEEKAIASLQAEQGKLKASIETEKAAQLARAEAEKKAVELKAKLEREHKLREAAEAEKKLALQQMAAQTDNVDKKAEASKPVAEKPKAVVAAGWPSLEQAEPAQIAYAKQQLAERSGLSNQESPLGRVEAKSSCSKNIDFTYLGKSLYSAVVELPGKFCTFEIFRDKFWFNIPANAGTESYRLIYDVTSISQPKAYLFKESLL